jgi:MGT family glycosyltransferase
MARFWFVSAPLVSHTDWGGFMKTAQALQTQGHTITWVSGAAIGDYVSKTGIPFMPVRATGWLWPPPPPPDFSAMPLQKAVMLRYKRALDTWLSEELVGDGVEELVELADQINKPDAIVSDPFLSAAALAAEALDVPLAVCGWPAQANLDETQLFPVQKTLGRDSQDRLSRLCQRFRLEGINFASGPTPSIISPNLHISYFNAAWYQAEASLLLAQNLFVGGAPSPPDDAPPGWLIDIPEDRPLALVTLGSTFTGDLGFFSWGTQAAARAGFVPIVVIGRNPVEPEQKEALKTALPPGTRLLNWVDFNHVLPRTRLAIHHGGMGTTHAITVHGIPQIVVPHAADQRGQARRVAQARIGLTLSAHDVRQGMLYEGALALAKDEKVQATALSFAKELAALGGPGRAAEALVKLAESRS